MGHGPMAMPVITDIITTYAPIGMRNQTTILKTEGKNSSEMKKAKVLHNPGAGEGETSKRELIRTIESAGFKCSYSSTKQFRWENIETEEVDFLILAGGDGTVRKVAEELLSRKVIEKNIPLGLLPMGTANNIAKTLGLCEDVSRLLESWHQPGIKRFDVGTITGLKEQSFFLESFGYGLFPRLMRGMKKSKKNSIDDPKERLQAALEMLLGLVEETPVKRCHLEIDGQDYSGEFLLVEVMNIRSIGPNLNFAPDADPADGQFDIVLITEKQRNILGDYVQRKIKGREVQFDFPVLKARQLKIRWEGKHLHVDDEYIKVDSPVTIEIDLREGLLEFLLPEKEN